MFHIKFHHPSNYRGRRGHIMHGRSEERPLGDFRVQGEEGVRPEGGADEGGVGGGAPMDAVLPLAKASIGDVSAAPGTGAPERSAEAPAPRPRLLVYRAGTCDLGYLRRLIHISVGI